MNTEPIDTIDTSELILKMGLGMRATNVLTRMGLKSVAQFASLTKETLLQRNNCGKKTATEIVEAIAKIKPLIEEARNAAIERGLMSAAMERMSIADLQLSVRATGVLKYLKISSVGQLDRVSDQELLSVGNFGKRSLSEVRSKLALLRSGSFVLWPIEQKSAGGVNRQVTRAARKLQRLSNALDLRMDDPRFGHLIREMGLEAKNARQAADLIVSRRADPIYPQPLIRRLKELIRALRAAGHISLEAELWSLTEGIESDRNRQIIVSHLGWDGKPRRTLEAVGQKFGMTRERVRQICTQMEKVLSLKPFVPVLERTLKIVERAAPALAEEIEGELVRCRITKSEFCLESLAAAAREFGREPQFAVEIIHGHRVVVPFNGGRLLDRIDQVARGAVSRWGVASVEDVAAATGAPLSLTQKILPLLSGFRWLDKSCGWFWVASTPRNSLLTLIRKILTASPSIDVGELRTGLGRHHRQKGFAPPRRVLLELCRQLSWCRVDGQRITTTVPLNASEVLSDSERIVFKVFKEHGPVIQRASFERLCLDAGMNHHTFSIFLSYCPLISRHAVGVYGLRGAEIPVGLIESLVPKRTNKAKQLLDYGWTGERNLRILYRVSESMLRNGVVSVPAALKAFVQGKFTLVTGDVSKIGTFVVRGNSAWGLGPFYKRRGGEAGDYLLLVFDLSRREVVVQIGDLSLKDELDAPDFSVPQAEESESVKGS